MRPCLRSFIVSRQGGVEIDLSPTNQRLEALHKAGINSLYGRLKRSDKAIVLRFLERVSGNSRQQITRLVNRGGERRAMAKRYRGSRTSFARIHPQAPLDQRSRFRE